MKAELEKMKFYVTNSAKNDVFVKSFEEVIRIIEFEMKDFIGKEKIKLDEAKNIEELEKMIETLNIKNKNNYGITVIYPVIIDYDNKKVLFYSSEIITEYFKENDLDFYKRKNIKELSDPYDLIKFGIEVKEVWNAEFQKKKKRG